MPASRRTIVANVLSWAGGSSLTSLWIVTTPWKGPGVGGGLDRQVDRVVRHRTRVAARRPAARPGPASMLGHRERGRRTDLHDLAD